MDQYSEDALNQKILGEEVSSSATIQPSAPLNAWKYISLFLLLAILISLGYSVTQKKNTKENKISPTPQYTVSPQPTQIIPTPLYQDIDPEITSDWEYKSLGRCDVSIPIPPKKEPYYYPKHEDREPGNYTLYGTGVYWMFPGAGFVPPMMLEKLPQYSPSANGYNEADGSQGNYKTELVMLGAEDRGGSGQVDAALSVSCIPNVENISNEQLENLLKESIATYNIESESQIPLMEADKYTIQDVEYVNKWGKDILLIHIDQYYKNPGGEPYTRNTIYTVFTTPKYIYEVTKINMANDSFLKETTDMIYDNLKFL